MLEVAIVFLPYSFQYAHCSVTTIHIFVVCQGWSSSVRNHIAIEIVCTHRKLLMLSILSIDCVWVCVCMHERWSTKSETNWHLSVNRHKHTHGLALWSIFYFIYFILFSIFCLWVFFSLLLCSSAHWNSNRHNIYCHRSKWFVIAFECDIVWQNWRIIDFNWIEPTHV